MKQLAASEEAMTPALEHTDPAVVARADSRLPPDQRILRRRIALSVAVLVPVASMLGVAGAHALRDGEILELGCWLLPRGQVMTRPASESCPLGMLETIRAIEMDGLIHPADATYPPATPPALAGRSVRVVAKRDGSEVAVDVPLLASNRTTRVARVSVAAIAAALMLSVPLFLLWRSMAPAAIPLTLFYGAASVVLTAMLAGQHSAGMTRAAVGALVLAPAALTHLALTFPRERAILREAPQILRLPYFVAATLVPIGWVALERDPLLGPAFLALLLVSSGSAWFVLLFACGLALRESDSAMERARARLVFFGALAAPLVPTIAFAPAIDSSARLGVFYVWSAAALMPLPIALAISRYNLFDLGWDVRHAVARIMYMGVAALAVSVILAVAMRVTGSTSQLSEIAPLYLVSFLCVAALEPLRTRMPGILEALMAPRLQRLRAARETLETQLSTLQDEDEIARRLGDAVRNGIGARSGCVLLCTSGEWRPAYPFGETPAAWTQLLDEALAALEGAGIVHLPAEPEKETHARSLRAARVAAVAGIGAAGERYGVLLVGKPRRHAPYTGVEIDFIRAVAAHAAVALRNAQINAELLTIERQATTGRLAVGLAHDLGKDLGWIRRLARKLPERFGDPERLSRDASMIRELSDGLAAAVARFVRDATRPSPRQDLETLDELVDRAARRVSRAHGAGRVTRTIDPALRDIRLHEHLERVLGNLLDNALHASPADATVHVFGTLEDDVVRITVEDHGSGIPEAMATRVFEPGVSTRLDRGGSGVGLTVAREIVETLGGKLELAPGSQGGTRATVRIPWQEDAA